jgi:hypothetical protein
MKWIEIERYDIGPIAKIYLKPHDLMNIFVGKYYIIIN